MKIKNYSKKHGIFNISADIHLIFPERNKLTGYFTIKDLNIDAKACFDPKMKHSDLNELVKSMEEAVELFIAKNEIEKAEEKKLIYIRYSSRNLYFNDDKNKSVEIDLSFDVFNTFWNDRILLKVVDTNGKEIPIKHNQPQHFDSDVQTIPYSKEAEDFLYEITSRISSAQQKLQSLFERDFLNQKDLKLEEKINLLINSKQKLLE